MLGLYGLINSVLTCVSGINTYRINARSQQFIRSKYVRRMASTEALRSPRPVIGVCQLTCTADKKKNLETATALVHRAKARGAQVKYSKTCLKQPLNRRPKIGFQDRLSLNAGQKYCRMLQGEHSAILSTFMNLPFVNKILVLSIFGWLLKTGFICKSNPWLRQEKMYSVYHGS